MFSWIIKMLLKFMKPFVKIAILSGLLGSILDLGGNEEETEAESNSEPVSEGE